VVSRIRRRTVLPQIRKSWRLSERRACEILAVNRRAVRYRSIRGDANVALRLRIRAIAEVRVRYGQRRIYVCFDEKAGRLMSSASLAFTARRASRSEPRPRDVAELLSSGRRRLKQPR
jgi:hypothetical protein